MQFLTGILLKNLRTYLGLSQDEFAQRFQLGDRNAVSRLEKMKILPNDLASKIMEQFESKEELTLLLQELDGISENNNNNLSTVSKGNSMTEQINSFLNNQFQQANLAKEQELKRLTLEKQAIEKELKQTNDKFTELCKNFDALKYEFEILKITNSQAIKDVLSETQKQTDEDLREFQQEVTEQIAGLVKELYQQTKMTDNNGLSGIGASLLENLPELIRVFATLKQMNPATNNNAPPNFNAQNVGYSGFYPPMSNADFMKNKGMNDESFDNNTNNFNTQKDEVKNDD